MRIIQTRCFIKSHATFFRIEILPDIQLRGVQGYLAHKKQRFPRTLQWDYA